MDKKILKNNDLAFRAPDGSDPDRNRQAFERTDARIKRVWDSVSEAVDTVEGQMADISTSVADVGQQATQISEELATTQGDLTELANNFEQWTDDWGSRIDTVFTTSSNPGFASIATVTTSSPLVMVAAANKQPRWQSSSVFVANHIGLTIPQLAPSAGWDTGTVPPANNLTGNHYNRIMAVVANIIQYLEDAGVFSPTLRP